MAGFELEALETAAPPFTGVIVAEILEATRHPQADKLQVCRVSTGSGEPVQIVCGAPNARAGLKSALAVVGAKLPGGLNIKAAKLRGVESQGMLCSAKELGLAESSNGILELPADAPVGTPLREYLSLDDTIVELEHHRESRRCDVGARHRARSGRARRQAASRGRRSTPVPAKIKDTFPVHLEAQDGCPKFVGPRHSRREQSSRQRPLWLRERLRRCGVRSISPRGRCHELRDARAGAADARLRPQRSCAARFACALGEARREDRRCSMAARRAADPTCCSSPMVKAPVGVAGIMGGERTVGERRDDRCVLRSGVLRAGCDSRPRAALGRRHGCGQRFERGVDPAHQERAIERATALMLADRGRAARAGHVAQSRGAPAEAAAGEAAPHAARAPARHGNRSRARHARRSPRCKCRFGDAADGWTVTPPSHRFDIAIEADLIEEVARIVGFDAIPEADAPIAQRFSALPEERPAERTALDTLAARGYYEAITFAFVDPALQKRLFPDRDGLALANADLRRSVGDARCRCGRVC